MCDCLGSCVPCRLPGATSLQVDQILQHAPDQAWTVAAVLRLRAGAYQQDNALDPAAEDDKPEPELQAQGESAWLPGTDSAQLAMQSLCQA